MAPPKDRKGKGRAPSVASPTPSTPVDNSKLLMPTGPVPPPSLPAPNQWVTVNQPVASSSTIPDDPFIEEGSALRYAQNLPVVNPAADAAQLARAQKSSTGTKRRVISSLTPAGLAADASSVPGSSRRVSAERAQKIQKIEAGDDGLDAEDLEEIERFAAALRAKKAQDLRVAAEKRAEEARLEEEERQRRAAEEAAAAEKLAAEKLAAEKLAAEKLAAEKLAAERLAAEKLAAEKKVAAEKVAAEEKRVAAEKTAAAQEVVGTESAVEQGDSEVVDEDDEDEVSAAEQFRRDFPPRSPAPGNPLYVQGGGAANDTSPARNTRSRSRAIQQGLGVDPGQSSRPPVSGNTPGKIVRRASPDSQLSDFATPSTERESNADLPYRADEEQEALSLLERNELIAYIQRVSTMDREARALVRDAIRRNHEDIQRVLREDARNKAERARLDEQLDRVQRERGEVVGRARSMGLQMNVPNGFALVGEAPLAAKVYRVGEKIPLTEEARQDAFAQWSAQTYEPLIERKCFECAKRLTVYGNAALECKPVGGPGPEWKCAPCAGQKSGCHPNHIDASLRPLINQIIVRQREYYALNDAQRKGGAGQQIKKFLAKPLGLLKGKLEQIEPLVAHANMGSYHPNVQADAALRLRRENLQLLADSNAMKSIGVSPLLLSGRTDANCAFRWA